MKELILNLIVVLNRLDRESDTVVMIDWNSRDIFISQSPGNNIQCNELWVLIDNKRESGKSFSIISSRKLESLKYYLIRFSNNFDNSSLVPDEMGFKILTLGEILFKNSTIKIWNTECEFDLSTSWLLRKFLKLTNKYYRQLEDSLNSINISVDE